MDVFKIYTDKTKPSTNEKEKIIDFLYQHLEEYGDKKEDILKCLNFAVKDSKNSLGGFVLVLEAYKNIQGVTIVNKTGMDGYIPENILVYIAVHHNARGKGYGKNNE